MTTPAPVVLQPPGGAAAPPPPVDVLLIEDNRGDVVLVEQMVAVLSRRAAAPLRLRSVSSLAAGIAAVRADPPPHAVILDLSLPDSHGVATLDRFRREAPGVPVIVLTGRDDLDGGVDAVRRGAQDYLVKGQVDGPVLWRAVRYAIERVRADEAMREAELRFRQVADNIADVFWISTPAQGLVYVSPSYATVWGRSVDAVLAEPSAFLWPIHPEDHDAVLAALPKQGTGTYDEEYRIVRPDGSVRWVRDRAFPVHDAAGTLVRVAGIAKDISGERLAAAALRETEARFRRILENIRAPAVQLDVLGHVTFVNDALLALTGWSEAEALGLDWFEHFVPPGVPLRAQFIEALATDTVAPQSEAELSTRDGGRRVIAWDHVVVHDADARPIGRASIGQDVTERRALESRLGTLTEQDELTGLLNRRGFRRVASEALRSAQQSGQYGAVLYVDLDHFKAINDGYGHAAGDEALRAVAGLLRATTRTTDSAARLGGDEFAICMIGKGEGDGAFPAMRLRAHLDVHNVAAKATGRPFEVGFSVGVAEFGPTDDLDTVLARADAALYAEKLSRRELTRARPRDGGIA